MVGHNSRTCPKPQVYSWSNSQVFIDSKLVSVAEVTALEAELAEAPLDAVVEKLLRARGYGGLASLLGAETDLDAWSERLYELAELTDCEEVLQLCALAMRDSCHFGRLNMWAAKQLRRDQAIAQCWPVEKVLERLTSIKE
jgi:hypothetical protein